MRVSIRHIDTCLASYVLDHCNGERECLLGVSVDHESTYASVKAGLLAEWDASDLYGRLDAPSDSEFAAALDDEFSGAPQPLDANRFAPSLEAPADDDDDEPGESPQAWFRIDWTAPEEAEEPPAPAYSLDSGRCIVAPSGLRLTRLHRVEIPESEHPDRASGAHTLSGPALDRFARQIVDALNCDPNRPDLRPAPFDCVKAHDIARRLSAGPVTQAAKPWLVHFVETRALMLEAAALLQAAANRLA